MNQRPPIGDAAGWAEHSVEERNWKPPIGYSNADSWAPPTESDAEGQGPSNLQVNKILW